MKSPNTALLLINLLSFSIDNLPFLQKKLVVFFLFGIIFHNLLEGLALGLQSDRSSAISLFTAIMLHGFPLATAVTTTLLNHWMPSDKSFSQLSFYLILICITRPFGMVLGICLIQIPGGASLIIAALLQVLNALMHHLRAKTKTCLSWVRKHLSIYL